MKTKNYLLVISLCLLHHLVLSQSYFGFKGGIGYYTWVINNFEQYDFIQFDQSPQKGINLSLFLNKKYGNFELISELNYAVKGSIIEGKDVLSGFDTLDVSLFQNFKVNYIGFSLLGRQVGLRKGKFELSVLYGPSVSYAINGRVKARLREERRSGPVRQESRDEVINFGIEQYNRLDIGLNIGIELSYSILDDIILLFESRYQFNFTNLNKIPDSDKVRNNGFSILLGLKSPISAN